MAIENIPEIYLHEHQTAPELLVYDFKMSDDVVNSKVNLSMNMFSFLQVGKKQVHFAGNSIAVNRNQSLLLKKGNWLWTELLEHETTYYCKLLFFSEKTLRDFLQKHSIPEDEVDSDIPFFVIKNDAYIKSYLKSLSALNDTTTPLLNNLLQVKFEELMLYLLQNYGKKFEQYLYSLINSEISSFKKIIESKVYSNLKLEEIAFLCNMSLSTFKRHFAKAYNISPGKWLQEKRLQKAKELLQAGISKPSEIYLDFGYNNHSNFSIAFKNKFGLSPKEVTAV